MAPGAARGVLASTELAALGLPFGPSVVSPLSVSVLGQTASAGGRLLAQGVVQSMPATLSLPPGPATAEVVSQRAAAVRPADQAATPLVASAVATTGGLRLRFSAALDLAPLARLAREGQIRTPDVVVTRGGQPIAGHLVLDPDGQGFAFRPDGAPLADGEYEMVVRTGGGNFMGRGGQLLDGDHDGRPGGDFRVRFVVKREAQASSAAADPRSALGIGWPGADEPAPVEAGWSILGSVGGAAMMMASLGPWGQRARRPVDAAGRTRRRPVPEAAPAPVVRFDVPAAPLPGVPPAPAPQWVSQWVAPQPAQANPWKITL